MAVEGEITVRVLIADSEWTFRRFLTDMLGKQKDLRVVGEAVDKDEALRLADQLRPDVVLMDMNLQGGSLAATRQIKSRFAKTRVIMLSLLRGESFEKIAVNNGADALIPKDDPISKILAAVRQEHASDAA